MINKTKNPNKDETKVQDGKGLQVLANEEPSHENRPEKSPNF